MIVLPTIGTYLLTGKVFVTTGVNGSSVSVYTSINSGSTWTQTTQNNATSVGGDIAITAMITTSVVNQQCQLQFLQSSGSTVYLNTANLQSYLNICKIAPF